MPDLFSLTTGDAAETRLQVFSVAEVTRAIRSVVEGAFVEVRVEGEVSNYRLQASGHQYFTLKDADSQLACVMFARGSKVGFQLRDGMLVQARGRITVYEARGQYQLNVSSIQQAGAGQLQARFEALKRKLDAEGLFDSAHKRPLPSFPRTLGIVTSPTGAALRDMLQILERRAPWLRIIVSPCRVQGDGAAQEIIGALDQFQQLDVEVDVIVLARGGGSMEDLWEFNDEDLARAIAGSSIPVVSAVGHEIDFTIADFVADLRAPTPSAAAELVAPDTTELLRSLAETSRRMERTAVGKVESDRAALALLSGHPLFREPATRIEQLAQDTDLAEQALVRAILDVITTHGSEVATMESRLLRHRPDQVLALYGQEIAAVEARLRERANASLSLRGAAVERVGAMLRLLSPEATLKRGYTITTDSDGAVLRSAEAAKAAGKMITRFADGNVASAAAKPRAQRKK